MKPPTPPRSGDCTAALITVSAHTPLPSGLAVQSLGTCTCGTVRCMPQPRARASCVAAAPAPATRLWRPDSRARRRASCIPAARPEHPGAGEQYIGRAGGCHQYGASPADRRGIHGNCRQEGRAPGCRIGSPPAPANHDACRLHHPVSPNWPLRASRRHQQQHRCR